MLKTLKKIIRKLAMALHSIRRASSLVLPYFIGSESSKCDVVYVIENANWSIRMDGLNIVSNLRHYQRNGWVDISSTLYRNKIIHFGSSYVFEQFAETLRPDHNKYLINFFHGNIEGDPVFNRRFELIEKYVESIAGLIYSTSIMKQRFLDSGFPENKLFHVPIGVDVNKFKPDTKQNIQTKRQMLGIPENALVVGSFQKDGEGWEEGLTPKNIKGPDVFLEVVKRLNREYPVFCVLSGPARGYVKKGLNEAGIPFYHKFFEDYVDVVTLYQILDVYVITSREEGGPKALLESLACGIPLITTNVGMAHDVISNHDCGIICDVDDVDSLVTSTLNIIGDDFTRQKMIKNGLECVQQYDWLNISKECESIYRAIEKTNPENSHSL